MANNLTRYKVNIGKRNKYFDTLEAAKAACQAVFERTSVVLSIVEVPIDHKAIVANPNFYGLTVVTLRATDHRGSFADNTHRVIIRMETDTDYFGWPDPTDPRNSYQWRPGVDIPLQYPKFAWEVLNG